MYVDDNHLKKHSILEMSPHCFLGQNNQNLPLEIP